MEVVRDLAGTDAQGRLREAHDLAPGVGARIAAIEVTRERTRAVGETTVEESTVKVRTWDKVRALELLGKHLGMFTDQVDHKHSGRFELVWAEDE